MNTDLLLVLVIVLAVANLVLLLRLIGRASSSNAEQAVRSTRTPSSLPSALSFLPMCSSILARSWERVKRREEREGR